MADEMANRGGRRLINQRWTLTSRWIRRSTPMQRDMAPSPIERDLIQVGGPWLPWRQLDPTGSASGSTTAPARRDPCAASVASPSPRPMLQPVSLGQRHGVPVPNVWSRCALWNTVTLCSGIVMYNSWSPGILQPATFKDRWPVIVCIWLCQGREIKGFCGTLIFIG